MLTWVSRVGTLGKELELLVIWRGSPGWFFKGAPGGTSTSGNSASFQTSIRYGQVVLEMTLKRTDGIATVQGKEVRLDGKNVILVDAADAPDGPRVVETLLIDSAFPPDRIEPVLRRSQKIIDFIQCDLKLPSERLNAVVQKLCAEIMK
jgi:hypothetical protein